VLVLARQHQRPAGAAEVRDDLRDWKLGRVITVVGRGLFSADNLAYLRRAGGTTSPACARRRQPACRDGAVPPGPLPKQVKDTLRVKGARLNTDTDNTDVPFIVCHTPEQAERDEYSATMRSRVSRRSWPASVNSVPAMPSVPRRTRPANATTPRTCGPNARCVTIPPSAGG
jgi:hypothetical protein